jgi:hypothetical protein
VAVLPVVLSHADGASDRGGGTPGLLSVVECCAGKDDVVPRRPREQPARDVLWVCPRGHLVEFSESLCAACRGEADKSEASATRGARRVPSLVALGAGALLLVIIAVAVNFGAGSDSAWTASTSSDATTTPTTAASRMTAAQTAQTAAYEDGRGYGQSLRQEGQVPEALACAQAPPNWETDLAPAWSNGCRDSYGSRREGGPVP